MVRNLLDEILLIRLVDLFQRVVAFVRKVKTTSHLLIQKGMRLLLLTKLLLLNQFLVLGLA